MASLTVPENDSVHNVQTNIKLCEALTGKKFDEEPPLEFYLTGEEENLSKQFYADHSIKDDELVIGFHPGCAIILKEDGNRKNLQSLVKN